jgi:regulator of protease activity HflC (stomatin/prohibitin superfamily)
LSKQDKRQVGTELCLFFSCFACQLKVINAEGEFLAAQRLVEGAQINEQHPVALQLRYLQTLSTIATENPSTTLFPVPIDLISPFLAAKTTT